MPGLENGSSIQNAFSWDHTQYPGGTRVFGKLTAYGGGGNYQDYWALYLLAGKTYVLQTRLPTAFDPYIYLYDSSGSYLLYDNNSGDDGGGMAKITYTPTKEGWYYIVIYLYSGSYGSYILESVPAPQSFRVFAGSTARLGARIALDAAVASRFEAVREKNAAGFAGRFSVYAPAQTGNAARGSARQAREHARASRFEAIKIATVVVSAGRYSARQAREGRRGARFSVRSGQGFVLPGRFDVRQPTDGLVPARFGALGRVEGIVPARHGSLVPSGWALYARNADTDEVVRLGFIPADADPKQISDVPLADGVWEIEVRPAQWYWEECRGRNVLTLIAGEIGGGGEPLQGLPAIQNLRREIVSFQSVIKWNVVAEYEPGAFRFGLWFSPTSPVDTSGAPDQTVAYAAGQGEYQTARAQTVPEHVAVAACADTEQGPAAELFLDWDPVAPASPSDQVATP